MKVPKPGMYIDDLNRILVVNPNGILEVFVTYDGGSGWFSSTCDMQYNPKLIWSFT